MADDDQPADAGGTDILADLHQKLDTIAKAETRRSQNVVKVLARVAEDIERLDSRTEDRLAAVRDAALAPAADLQALLSARNKRNDAQLAELAVAVQALADRRDPTPTAPSAPDSSGPVLEHLEELARAVQSLTSRLPELAADLAAVREQVERIDVVGPLAEVTQELSDRFTLHTDTALAAALHLIDDRLRSLRTAVVSAGGSGAAPPPKVEGFEAGAVMGVAQPAWNQLERRLDSRFDDLSHQLQTFASLVEQAFANAEAVATPFRRVRGGGPGGLGSDS